MARAIPSRIFVTGLVASALVGVSVLAIQANGAETDTTAGRKPSSSPAASTPSTPKAPALPGKSGEGKRIVYSVGKDRVWIVNARANKKVTTFAVWPGSVDPPVGLHRVTYLLPGTDGTDGVPIEHVIYFSEVDGTSVAFSAALDGSKPSPVPGKKTGGVRVRRGDGEKLWDFATIGTPVVVVP